MASSPVPLTAARMLAVLAVLCTLLKSAAQSTVPRCGIEMRKPPAAATNTAGVFNFADFRLFKTGIQVPSTDLVVSMSSTYSEATAAAMCLDGNDNTFSRTQAGDPDPTIVLTYPCASGVTEATELHITNRADCCKDSLKGSTLRMLHASGNEGA